MRNRTRTTLIAASAAVAVATEAAPLVAAKPSLAQLKKNVDRFVTVKGEPVETTIAKEDPPLWVAYPRELSACVPAAARAWPAMGKVITLNARALKNDTVFVENGELALYTDASVVPRPRRASFVAALDRVGKALDRQLALATWELQLGASVAHGVCGQLSHGPAKAVQLKNVVSEAHVGFFGLLAVASSL